MKRNYEARLILLAVVLLFALSGITIGQEVSGTIIGTVKDSTGAAVVGATITVADSEKKGNIRTLTTNDFGQFSAPNLGSGFYDVTIEAPNFKSILRAE